MACHPHIDANRGPDQDYHLDADRDQAYDFEADPERGCGSEGYGDKCEAQLCKINRYGSKTKNVMKNYVNFCLLKRNEKLMRSELKEATN